MLPSPASPGLLPHRGIMGPRLAHPQGRPPVILRILRPMPDIQGNRKAATRLYRIQQQGMFQEAVRPRIPLFNPVRRRPDQVLRMACQGQPEIMHNQGRITPVLYLHLIQVPQEGIPECHRSNPVNCRCRCRAGIQETRDQTRRTRGNHSPDSPTENQVILTRALRPMPERAVDLPAGPQAELLPVQQIQGDLLQYFRDPTRL
jgi:hypothetical protein